MSLTVQEFLNRKGAVGLLSVLTERGKSYSEIEEEVAITTDTISRRKDEAMEIGLIELKPARRGDRTVQEYHLTDFGEALAEQMSLKGIVSNYQDMRTHQEKVEQKTEDLIDWLGENRRHFLGFTEAHEETLIERSENIDSGSPESEQPDDTESTGSEQTGDTDSQESNDDGKIVEDHSASEDKAGSESEDVEDLSQSETYTPDIREAMREAPHESEDEDSEEN